MALGLQVSPRLVLPILLASPPAPLPHASSYGAGLPVVGDTPSPCPHLGTCTYFSSNVLSFSVLTAPSCPTGKHLLLLSAYCKCQLLQSVAHSIDFATLSIGMSASPLCYGSSSPRATWCLFLSHLPIEAWQTGVQHVC